VEDSTFEEYEAGTVIYREGEIDEFMYVIVKGCVKQYEQKVTSYNEKIMVNFTSHYEGSNFGEVQGYV
jgi:Cyclic nucleotide-binding domain